MSRILILSLLVLSAMPAMAAFRTWHRDDKRTYQAEYLSRDETSVSLRLTSNKKIAVPIDELHPDDLAWLKTNHPLPTATAGNRPATGTTGNPPADGVFDQLAFNDTRNQVLAKLKVSKFVVMTMNETFIGRTGLNGIFRTRKKIGTLDAALYFDWTEVGALKEITLQTDPLPAAKRDEVLAPCWKEFIVLLTTLYGNPINMDNDLHLDPIQDGTFAPSHLWQLDGRGSALLGAARAGDKYQIVVRFSQKEVKPVERPAGN